MYFDSETMSAFLTKYGRNIVVMNYEILCGPKTRQSNVMKELHDVFTLCSSKSECVNWTSSPSSNLS